MNSEKSELQKLITTHTDVFKLAGLNKPWKARGFNSIYATVDLANEDWFHAPFDESQIPVERQFALFDYMNHPDQMFKGATVTVRHEGYSTGGVPINPIIIQVNNLP